MVSAIRCAPPASASKRPSITPKPNIKPIWPSVPPSPDSTEVTTLLKSIPLAMATAIETIINETNVLSLIFMVKSRSKAIPATTIISGITSSHNRVATHHYPTEQITNDAESDNSGVWMFLFMLSVFIHKIAQSRANFVYIINTTGPCPTTHGLKHCP